MESSFSSSLANLFMTWFGKKHCYERSKNPLGNGVFCFADNWIENRYFHVPLKKLLASCCRCISAYSWAVHVEVKQKAVCC